MEKDEKKVETPKSTAKKEETVDVNAFVARKLNALNQVGGAKAEKAMARVLKYAREAKK